MPPSSNTPSRTLFPLQPDNEAHFRYSGGSHCRLGIQPHQSLQYFEYQERSADCHRIGIWRCHCLCSLQCLSRGWRQLPSHQWTQLLQCYGQLSPQRQIGQRQRLVLLPGTVAVQRSFPCNWRWWLCNQLRCFWIGWRSCIWRGSGLHRRRHGYEHFHIDRSKRSKSKLTNFQAGAASSKRSSSRAMEASTTICSTTLVTCPSTR